MSAVVTELTIDARGATQGSAEYVRAMAVAQAAVDRMKDREDKLAAGVGKATDMMMAQSTSIGRVSSNWDRLRASIDPVAKAQLAAAKHLDTAMLTADAAVKRGVTTQQEAARIITNLRQKQVAELNAVREAAQRANAAQNAPIAANQNRRLSAGQLQGMSFQANDIVTMALLGAPISQIAASQGGQILQVLQQGDGGIKGSLKAIKTSAVDAVGAVAGFLGPLGMIATGFGVAAIAAGAFYMLTRKEAKTADELLKEQTKSVEALGNAYGDVASKAKQAFSAGNQNSFAISSSMSANGLKLAMANQTRDLMSEVGQFVSPGKSAGGYFGVVGEFKPFADAIMHLRKTATEGTPDILGFKRMVEDRWALEPNNAALTATAGKLQELTKDSVSLAEALRQLDIIRRQLFNDVGPNGMLLSQGPSNRADMGNLALFEAQEGVATARRRAAAKAQLQGLLARSPAEQAAAARAAAGAQYNDNESAAARADRIDIAGKLALAQAEKSLADARKERARSLQETMASQQLEISLIGQTAGEIARLRMEYDLTSKLREEAARNGIEADQKEIDLIKQKATEYGRFADEIARTNLVREVQFEREQLFRSPVDQDIAARLRGAGLPVDLNSDIAKTIRENERINDLRNGIRGFFDDFEQGLMRGDSFGKALGNAILNALNNMLDKVLDNLADQITSSIVGSMTGGKAGAGGGILGALFGGVGAAVSGGGLRGVNDNYAPGAVTRSPLLDIGSTAVSGMEAYRGAIKAIESVGSGGYSALGPVLKNGNQALGAYQVMKSNLPSWSQEALGKTLTPNQFLASPASQDKVFDHFFGKSLSKFGNPQDAASVWFTGRPTGAASGAAKDILGTSGSKYVDKFTAHLEKSTASLGKLGTGVDKMTTGATEAGMGLNSLGGGLTKMGNALNQFPAAPGGGGGGSLLSGLFSGGLSSAFSGTAAFNWLSANPGGYIGLYADGGRVTGPGSGTSDSVPAMLSNGEYVVKASAASKYLPFLEAINDNRIQHRATGGPIGRVGSSAPMSLGGGNKVNININNLAGAQVSAEATEQPDGSTSIDVLVDRVVADKLSTRGSASNNTMRQQFGAQSALKRR